MKAVPMSPSTTSKNLVQSAALVALCFLAPLARAQTGDRYALAIYAAQNGDVAIDRASHNFAAFVHVPPASPSDEGATRAPEVIAISWLPARLPICVVCTEPVPGRNYELRETIEIERAAGLRVSQWGPYEIDAALFASAARQARHLASGAARYVVWDRDLRPQAINCIHAVSDVDATRPPLATGTAIGDAAGEALVRFYGPRVRGRFGTAPSFRRLLGIADLPVLERTP
jgi:hypothetical protein